MNILFKYLITREPDSEAVESFKLMKCILYKENEVRIMCSPEILVRYETLFSKVANGYYQYQSNFLLPLEQNKQIEYVESVAAPCSINDSDDQVYLDCAFGCKADFIISNDSDFKLFDLGECQFLCYNSQEFLSHVCTEYV